MMACEKGSMATASTTIKAPRDGRELRRATHISTSFTAGEKKTLLPFRLLERVTTIRLLVPRPVLTRSRSEIVDCARAVQNPKVLDSQHRSVPCRQARGTAG